MASTMWLVCLHVLLLAATPLMADEISQLEDQDNTSPIEQGKDWPAKRSCPRRCEGTCYNPVEKQCCNSYLINGFFSCSNCTKSMKKCEDRCMPVSGYQCCHKKVIPTTWTCCPHHCGSKCYNAATQKCCNNQIIPRSKDCCIKPIQSCGDSCYNTTLAKCCHDKVIDIKATCCTKCKGKCINLKTQQCCNNKVISSSQTCCKPGLTACGKGCYNPKTHSCCHGYKILSPGQICCRAGKSVCAKNCYNPRTHRCCHGYKIVSPREVCCRAHEKVCSKFCLNPKSQQCCHNRVLGRNKLCCRPGQSPCGKTCLQPASQFCCHGKVLPRGQRCCNPGDKNCGHKRMITQGLWARYIGCYRDHGNRAIPTLEGRDRLLVGSYRSRKYAIEKCALAAAKRGWKYFAVQHQGWCASSPTAGGTYNKYGRYNTCRNGKGGPWGNDVYKLQGAPSQKTTGGEICVFPFIYKGKKHNRCTLSARPLSLWCAVTPNYDADKLRGNCVIKCSKPFQRPCGISCYNTMWARCCPGGKIGNKWGSCPRGGGFHRPFPFPFG